MESIIIDDVVLEEDVVNVWIGDEFSLQWLKALKFDKIGKGIPLLKFWEEEQEKLLYCTIKIKIRITKYKEEEFKNQLLAGNQGLQIKKLELREAKALDDGIHQIVSFVVDKGAVDYFESVKGKVRFDLGRTFVNFPQKNRFKRQKLDEV